MSRGYPLSFSQQRLWFQEAVAPGNRGYLDQVAFLVHGVLDIGALRRAFDRLFERHSTLRTTFEVAPGAAAPTQVVHAGHGFELPLVEVAPQSPIDRRETVRAEAVRLAEAGFDLGTGPLLRATLISWGPEQHALIVIAHHIVVDGWSFAVITDELSTLYAAEAGGLAPDLAPLPLQYTDFVLRQRDDLAGEQAEEELTFWAQHLAGIPDRLTLPTDRPRPEKQTYSGDTLNVDLSDTAADAVATLCADTRTTPYMTLTAAVSVVLRAMASQDDIVVGTPVAGRAHSASEGLIGLFLNMIAVRVRIDPDRSLRELLRDTRTSVLRSLAHQSTPFEQVVEGLRVTRLPDASPVFQVSVLVSNLPPPILRLTGTTIEPVVVELDGSRYDLTTTFIEREGRWRLRLNYNTDLFDEATMRLLVERIETVLVHGATHLEDPVRTLPIIGGMERRTLAANGNVAADGPEAEAVDVIDLLADRAAAMPTATALIDDERSMSYAELNTRSTELARALGAAGVRAGDVVATMMSRSIQLPITVVALWKAGACFLPLDGTHPRTRMSLMIDRARPTLVIADAVFADSARELTTEVTTYDSLAGWTPTGLARQASRDPARAAYLMFTSGSTGIPKGVVVSRGALAAFCVAALDVVDPQPDDISLSITTYTFDISLLEYLVPLLRGAAVRLCPGDATDIDGVRRALATPGLSLAGGTPTTWRSVLDSGAALPPGLQIMLGGEATPDDLAHRLREAGAGLWSFYGPTEATVYATVTRYHPPSSDDGASDGGAEVAFRHDDLGRPFGASTVRVLDEDGALTPIGVSGTIHLGGPQLADGYLGRPEETARRFIDVDGVHLYDTGDRGRWSSDGRLLFEGRSDSQVKLHGFRVELSEIELHLRRHSGLRDAAVLLADLGTGTPELVAHLTATTSGEASLTADELRRWLAAQLPGYMVPAIYTYHSELPRTGNGKLDRRALLASSTHPTAVAAPVDDDLVTAVCQLVADTLNVDGVRVDDGFFTIGGTSLLAVELVLRLNELVGVRFSPADVAAAPTPLALAGRIAEQVGRGETAVHALATLRPTPAPAFPVVFLPSSTGTCWESVALLSSIPREFAVVGLQVTPEYHDDPVTAFADLLEDSFEGAPCVLVGWGEGAAVTACELADELAGRDTAVPLTIVRGSGNERPREHTARGHTELVVFSAPGDDPSRAELRDWVERAAIATHVVELAAGAAPIAIADEVAGVLHKHLTRVSEVAH
ncbi:non-ribosomal peptide synthetase [Pseudonocardia spinosispora]|uniref:non-ribosomal peptide synthetase n=1 Tax=Pseudonocardia spinosispora TaxID=103441 RepID=UPI0004139C38|nr:non-ribosomal peptide synthetase [Pseudonocardia spinosispora]